MVLGQTTVSDLVGTALYVLTWYLVFRLLVGLIPASPGEQRIVVLITALFALSGLLAMGGSVVFGWPPLWILFYDQLYHPASVAELVMVPLALLALLGVWGALSLPGLPADRADRRLRGDRLLLIVAIGLLYELGMAVFAWPPPWPWLFPSTPG